MLMVLFNFAIGIFLLHQAYHPVWRQHRPMTWTRFRINKYLGLANLAVGCLGIYNLVVAA